MDNTNYRTGSWLGIVRSGSVIVLEADTDLATVEALWDYLGSKEPSIQGVLNAVTARLGGELLGMAQFGIVVQSDRLHTILRGEVSLLLETAGSHELVSGRDVTTWSERSLPLPDSLVLTMSEPTAAVGESASGTLLPSGFLPMGESVVRLQELRIGGLAADSINLAAPAATAIGGAGAGGAPQGVAFQDVAAQEEGQDAGDVGAFSLAQDQTAHQTADQADVVESPVQDQADEVETPANSAQAEDVFADFALASDAEWNAQLADPASAEISEDLNNDMESDLSRTLLPNSDEASVPFDADAEENLSDAEAVPANEDKLETSAPEVDADGFTANYDHLFGETEVRNVEDAAIRYDEDGHIIPKDPAKDPGEDAGTALPPRPPMPPASGPSADTPLFSNLQEQPNTSQSEESMDGRAGEAGAARHSSFQAAPPAPAPTHPWQPSSGLLIDSVPWRTDPTPRAPSSGSSMGQSSSNGSSLENFGSDEAVDEDSDHDGQTVMVNRKEVSANLAAIPGSLESRPPTGPTVLARLCPAGHANPPTRSQCSNCGLAISSEPREVGRPRLGRMHISTGEILDLDHSLIIGRQPSLSRVMGGVLPRLVQVHSAGGDISRSHVEVHLEGWDVMLVDLKATNGTVLVRIGQAPRRLGQGEQAILIDGDVAELGDGVSLLFEGLL